MKKSTAILLLLALALIPCVGFISDGGGYSGSAVNALHADNIDNAGGLNVVLSGAFSGDANNLQIGDVSQLFQRMSSASPFVLSNLTLFAGEAKIDTFTVAARSLKYPETDHILAASLPLGPALFYPPNGSDESGTLAQYRPDLGGMFLLYPNAVFSPITDGLYLYAPDGNYGFQSIVADSFGNRYGKFIGNGSGLTNLPASAVPVTATNKFATTNAIGVNLSGAFSGDGSGLTNFQSSLYFSKSYSLESCFVSYGASGIPALANQVLGRVWVNSDGNNIDFGVDEFSASVKRNPSFTNLYFTLTFCATNTGTKNLSAQFKLVTNSAAGASVFNIFPTWQVSPSVASNLVSSTCKLSVPYSIATNTLSAQAYVYNASGYTLWVLGSMTITNSNQ